MTMCHTSTSCKRLRTCCSTGTNSISNPSPVGCILSRINPRHPRQHSKNNKIVVNIAVTAFRNNVCNCVCCVTVTKTCEIPVFGMLGFHSMNLIQRSNPGQVILHVQYGCYQIVCHTTATTLTSGSFVGRSISTSQRSRTTQQQILPIEWQARRQCILLSCSTRMMIVEFDGTTAVCQKPISSMMKSYRAEYRKSLSIPTERMRTLMHLVWKHARGILLGTG